MSIFPRQSGYDLFWGLVMEVIGESPGDPDDISYNIQTIGLEGKEVLWSEVQPTTRSASGVDIEALPIGTPVIIFRDTEQEITFWPLGVEEIPFKECEVEPDPNPEGSRVVEFFKQFVRRR